MILYDNQERLVDNLDKRYINRSKIYLWPAVKLLKSYRFIIPLMKDEKLNFACGIDEVEGLTIISNVKQYARLTDLIENLQVNEEYINDRIITADHHAVTIRIPVNLEAFVKGYYSQIYTKDQVDKCFSPDRPELQVINQDRSYFPKFFKQMKANFEVAGSYIPPQMKEELFDNYTEYDIPPCLGQEVIFYKSN